jgi:hypothetical protein
VGVGSGSGSSGSGGSSHTALFLLHRRVFVSSGVSVPFEVMRPIVEAAGGAMLNKAPAAFAEDVIIITGMEDFNSKQCQQVG